MINDKKKDQSRSVTFNSVHGWVSEIRVDEAISRELCVSKELLCALDVSRSLPVFVSFVSFFFFLNDKLCL